MIKMGRLKNKKVICAMSGGVDSSVSAVLLKRAGFDVIGVFMKFWATPNTDGLVGAWNRCCSPEAEKRARKVAQILNISFYVLNFEEEFKNKIVDYFLREYKKGNTPNPCVVCNKEIKFRLLLEKALALGADYIATGHYARLQKGKEGIRLLKGKDKKKDQSYFLWMLSQRQLKRILFPIGNYTKNEVRLMAKKFKLPVLGIPESQEICFIHKTINDFLRKHLKTKPGRIIYSTPEVNYSIGEHQGLWFYTIGQRKGLGLGGGPAFAKALAGKPYYVLDKNQRKNLLVVTKNERDLDKKELVAKNVNWISGKSPDLPLKVKAKIRYRHRSSLATITKKRKSNLYHLRFEKPQRAITPGQSVVFYKGQEVIGGGIIK